MNCCAQAYYDALNVAQRGDGEVTPWLAWLLDTSTEACRTSAELIDEALARARFWTDHRAAGPSGRSTRYDLALPGWEWRAPMQRRAATGSNATGAIAGSAATYPSHRG
jgi:hypothetical protein